MNLELSGTSALIAGASRGIGLSIARAFLREGARVAITGRDRTSLDAAVRMLVDDAGDGRVFAIQADMTEPAQIRVAVEQTRSALGGPTSVVANVGSGVAPRGWNLTMDDWLDVLRVNLLGAMALATESLPALIEAGGGSMTMVSSIAGREAISAPIPYSAAKSALETAVKSLARSVGEHKVRVNAVAPGNILFEGGMWDRRRSEQPEEVGRYIDVEVPLRRFGCPEEIADAVVFLSSKRASFITGASLVVDGGQTRGF